MATKSILKQVTIKNKKECKQLVDALENAVNKSSKEVIAAQAHVASVEDVKKMFDIK